MSAIVAASPVFVIPARANLSLMLPEPLLAALRARHAEMVSDHERMRFKPMSFDEWLEFHLTTLARGDGRPRPAEAR